MSDCMGVRGRGEGKQQTPGSQGPHGFCVSSLPSDGYRNSRVSSVMDNLRARVRTYQHRQGYSLQPTNGNVHMEHVYIHITFVEWFSYLIFSFSSYFILSKCNFILHTEDVNNCWFFLPSPFKFFLKWENSANLIEKNTITGFDLTSFDMWNKNNYSRRLWETLMENYRWWITHRKTHFVLWMQSWELK